MNSISMISVALDIEVSFRVPNTPAYSKVPQGRSVRSALERHSMRSVHVVGTACLRLGTFRAASSRALLGRRHPVGSRPLVRPFGVDRTAELLFPR